MKYWFVADEHYDHTAIIKYCNRPFDTVGEMNQIIIDNHNSVVSKEDVVIHAGDFTWGNATRAKELIKQLSGNHVFLRGSHDKWLPRSYHEIWEKRIDKQVIVVCHYAMRVWPRSHYNSWQLHGHSHGRLKSIGKQYDVGVDNNNFYPVSSDAVKCIMEGKPDNLNLVQKNA
jgi:calcineurin-like phosphoesterase family protein